MNTPTPQSYTSDLPMVLTASPPSPGQDVPHPVAAVTAREAQDLSLTAPQQTAIINLTSGRTRCEAADAAGVSRSTLYRWMNHDPAFQAAFNAWQQDVLSTAQAQLTSGTRDALVTVLAAIRAGDARLAWKLLESQGVTARPASGPTDVDELKRIQAMEQKKRDLVERKERVRLKDEEMSIVDLF